MAAAASASLKLVWAAMLGAMLGVLGVSYAMRPRMTQQDGLGVLTWMSIAWAVLSTVTAVFLRSVAGEAEAGPRRRGIEIASLATLESGVLLAAVFHMVSPLDFGLYAALLPLAAMLAFLPRDPG